MRLDSVDMITEFIDNFKKWHKDYKDYEGADMASSSKSLLIKRSIGGYADQLFHATTFEEAFSAFDEQIKNLGFEGALYTFIPRIALDSNLPLAPVFSVSETYSQDYMRHYLEARFDRDDNIIKMIQNGCSRTLDWWDEIEKGAMDKGGENVVITAREDYQVINGLTIPTLVGAKGIAGASFISSETERLYSKLKHEVFEALETSARMFHAAVMCSSYHFNTFIKPLLANLSDTEKNVLKYLSHGLPVTIVADRSGKSIRYTENLVRNIRLKFGGVTEEGRPKITTSLLLYYIGLMELRDEL